MCQLWIAIKALNIKRLLDKVYVRLTFELELPRELNNYPELKSGTSRKFQNRKFRCMKLPDTRILHKITTSFSPEIFLKHSVVSIVDKIFVPKLFYK